MPAPIFFVDRSLGVYDVPEALRAAGWQIVTMRERYGELTGQRTEDPDWIRDATRDGHVLLCKDKRIAKRPVEARAIVTAGAKAFALGNGELTGPAMAERFLRHQDSIFRRCADAAPFVISVGHQSLIKLELNVGRAIPDRSR
jgi:hypothetical protein